MANITEEHLHHMAKRHHTTLKKFDALKDKFSGMTERAVRTVEVGAGAWAGGIVEGRTGGGTVMHVPINLGVGVALAAAGYLDLAGDEYSPHLNAFGDGFIASYVAATGYAFGKRWRDTGKVFGAKADAALPSAAAAGDLSEGQMAEIVARMQAAAAG
jgi:hypothetical protein